MEKLHEHFHEVNKSNTKMLINTYVIINYTNYTNT